VQVAANIGSGSLSEEQLLHHRITVNAGKIKSGAIFIMLLRLYTFKVSTPKTKK
jgi:hypothetical protein